LLLYSAWVIALWMYNRRVNKLYLIVNT